jgi:hypothetical protein
MTTRRAAWVKPCAGLRPHLFVSASDYTAYARDLGTGRLDESALVYAMVRDEIYPPAQNVPCPLYGRLMRFLNPVRSPVGRVANFHQVRVFNAIEIDGSMAHLSPARYAAR